MPITRGSANRLGEWDEWVPSGHRGLPCSLWGSSRRVRNEKLCKSAENCYQIEDAPLARDQIRTEKKPEKLLEESIEPAVILPVKFLNTSKVNKASLRFMSPALLGVLALSCFCTMGNSSCTGGGSGSGGSSSSGGDTGYSGGSMDSPDLSTWNATEQTNMTDCTSHNGQWNAGMPPSNGVAGVNGWCAYPQQ